MTTGTRECMNGSVETNYFIGCSTLDNVGHLLYTLYFRSTNAVHALSSVTMDATYMLNILWAFVLNAKSLLRILAEI